MYTKQQESKQRQAFWTTFGQYMQPVLSADGAHINWVNYKTGIPGISFKMDADNKSATVAIMLSIAYADAQQMQYDQLLALKAMLHSTTATEWHWQPPHTNEYGKLVSAITSTIANVNINRNEDWPTLISFFKTRIVALDEFWSMVKDGF